MLKITKYFKPYIGLLLLAIALLYIQAQADLALPDYMSRIVNVGIQQSGVESAVPQFLGAADYQRLRSSIPEQSARQLLASYRQVDSAGKVDILGQTVDFGNQTIYLLKSDIDQSALESAFTEDLQMQKTRMVALTTAIYRQNGIDMTVVQRQYILRVGIVMVAISLLAALCIISVVFIAARVAAGVGRDLRMALISKIESFHAAEFDTFSSASLITRSTNDVMQIQSLMVIVIRMLFYAPIIGVGGVIHAMTKSVSMSWIIALAVIVLMGLIGLIFSIVIPKFKRLQRLVDRVNLVVRESLTGMLVVRAFHTQAYESNKFEQANDDLNKTNLFVNRTMVFLPTLMMFIMNATMLLIVWIGAKQVAQSQLQVGDMMAFMQYAMMIIMAFLMLSMMFVLIPRALVSAQRIGEVLHTQPSVSDINSPKPLPESMTGTVRFDDVSFRYPNAKEDAISQISFSAQPGKTTAIIGSTGSGKSTILNLLLRFYDPTAGKISIDQQDISQFKLADLRSLIGYVPQKVQLFSGTIADNVQYGKTNAPSHALDEALSTAQAMDFVETLENGKHAQVAQGGSNLSGGQKQRISIARALIRQPLIYLFDDSFSALDFKTDRQLRNALADKTDQSVVIIVAQRIATVKQADQIIVLDQGRLAGIGQHRQLLEACTVYREIAYSQLSEEELA